MRYEEISRINSRTERRDGGVSHSGAGMHTNAEMPVDDDDLFPTKVADISESRHRQKNGEGEEQRQKKTFKSDHGEANESPIASPTGNKLSNHGLSTAVDQGQ